MSMEKGSKQPSMATIPSKMKNYVAGLGMVLGSILMGAAQAQTTDSTTVPSYELPATRDIPYFEEFQQTQELRLPEVIQRKQEVISEIQELEGKMQQWQQDTVSLSDTIAAQDTSRVQTNPPLWEEVIQQKEQLEELRMELQKLEAEERFWKSFADLMKQHIAAN